MCFYIYNTFISDTDPHDGEINLKQLWNEVSTPDLVTALRNNTEIQRLLSEAGLTDIDSHTTTENEVENIPAQQVVDAQFENDAKCRIKLVIMPPAHEEPVFLESVIEDVRLSLIANLKSIQRRYRQLDTANPVTTETEVRSELENINEVPTNIKGPNALKIPKNDGVSPRWLSDETGLPNFPADTPTSRQAYLAMMCAVLEHMRVDTSHALLLTSSLPNPNILATTDADNWPKNWQKLLKPEQAKLEMFGANYSIIAYKDFCPEDGNKWHVSILGKDTENDGVDRDRHTRNQVGSVLLILKNQHHIPLEKIRFGNLEARAPVMYPNSGMQHWKTLYVKQTEQRIVDESWNDENADVIGHISSAITEFGEVDLRIREDFQKPGFMIIEIDVSDTYTIEKDSFVDQASIINSTKEGIAENIGESLETALIAEGLLDSLDLSLLDIHCSQPVYEKYVPNGLGNKITIEILQMGNETVDPSSFNPEHIQVLIERIQVSYSNGDDIVLYVTFEQCEVTTSITKVYVSMYKENKNK